jgi:hypothetical protein
MAKAAKKSKRQPVEDVNQAAARIVKEVTQNK